MDYFLWALIGSILSPLAIIGFLVAFRDKLMDHFFAARMARIEGSIKQVLDTHRAMLKFGSTIDLDLRKRRIEAYQDLWNKTALVPRWPRATDVRYSQLKQFSAEMRTWYFEKGGMYLSKSSQDKYSDLQKGIWNILDTIDAKALEGVLAGSEGPESDGHYDAIRRKCSALRTSFTRDVLSRKAAPEPDGSD
jgi:hypothetical protein